MIRNITKKDKAGYLSLRSQLGNYTETMSDATFREKLSNIKLQGGIIVVMELNGELVATGKLLIEHKLFDPVGHIEDIVTDVKHRNSGYGKQIVDHLLQLAKTAKCYKTVLSCSEDNVEFYKKSGLIREGVCMVTRRM